MIFSVTTLARVAEALRACATDIDAYLDKQDPVPFGEPADSVLPAPSAFAASTIADPAANVIPATETPAALTAARNGEHPLTDADLAALRNQMLDIIKDALTGAPATAVEQVTAVLRQFGANRVSELTGAAAPLALTALKTAFPGTRPIPSVIQNQM
jgi:hypothetical protein